MKYVCVTTVPSVKGGRGKEGAGGNRRAGGGERPLKRNIGVNAVRVDFTSAFIAPGADSIKVIEFVKKS